MLSIEISKDMFEQCILDVPELHFQRKLTRLLTMHGFVGLDIKEMTSFWYKAQLYFSLAKTASMQRYKEAPLYSMFAKRLLDYIGNGYCSKWLLSGIVKPFFDFRLHPQLFYETGLVKCRDLGCSTLGNSIDEVLLTLKLLPLGLSYCPSCCSCRDLESNSD